MGKRCGIVVGGQGDPFVRPAGDLRDHILGGGDGFRLFHPDGNGSRGSLHQFEGVLRIDVDAGNFPSLRHIGTERLPIDVPVFIAEIPVVGNEPDGACVQQVLVDPVGDPRIQQDDLSLCLHEGGRIRVGQVAQRRFHAAAAAQLESRARNLLPVRGQYGFTDLRRLHVEGLQERCYTALFAQSLQVSCRLLFLFGSADADIVCLFQDFPDCFWFHAFCPLSFNCYC